MESWFVIIGIAFWVLAALATIGIIGYAFVSIQYYRCDKQERAEQNLAEVVSNAVADTISEKSEEKAEEVSK